VLHERGRESIAHEHVGLADHGHHVDCRQAQGRESAQQADDQQDRTDEFAGRAQHRRQQERMTCATASSVNRAYSSAGRRSSGRAAASTTAASVAPLAMASTKTNSSALRTRHGVQVDTAINLLVEIGQARNGTQEADAALPTAAPVHAQVRHDRHEPRLELGRAVASEAAQPAEPVVAQCAADVTEALRGPIGVLEVP